LLKLWQAIEPKEQQRRLEAVAKEHFCSGETIVTADDFSARRQVLEQ